MTRITRKYILNKNGDPVVEPSLMKWGRWMEKKDSVVKQETIGGVFVSTVFLGLDHNFTGHGPPVLWETMCFGKASYCNRCSGSREQAEAMHERMVKHVKKEVK